MFGALVTMFLFLFGMVGGMVAGAIIRTRRLEGTLWAIASAASVYIGGSASITSIRIALFAIYAVTVVGGYIDSVLRAKDVESQSRSATV